MYGLLRYVSGVPLLEQTMLKSRGDLFRAYQQRVSVFFPFPPRAR
jgi:steroid 5-alpha reductase family enzyme